MCNKKRLFLFKSHFYASDIVCNVITALYSVTGINLPLDSMTRIPNNLTPSISNAISESITGGISTSIPSGMMADMPASIPTLNLGQSLHRVEQLQQTHEARNPWYPTGILAIL